jgi:hypothetical protein
VGGRDGLDTVRDETEGLLAANRANWDDRTGVHLESRFYDVEGWLRDGRGPRSWDAEALGNVHGLRPLHLQCNFGQDTLAWARAGAEVTGLDSHPRRSRRRGTSPEQRLSWGCFEEAEPFVWDSDQTYTDATRPIEHGRTYEWNHSIGEIITALVDHGLTIDRLEEHDWTVCQLRPWLVELEPGRWGARPGAPRLPLSFSLHAHRRP